MSLTPAERAAREAMARQVAAGLRLRKNTFGEIERLLKVAGDRVAAILSAAPTDYESWYLPQLQQAIQQALEDVRREAPAALDRAFDQALETGAATVTAPLAAAGFNLAGIGPVISPDQLLAMKSFALDRIRDVITQMANRIGDQLALTVTGAQSVSDTLDEVQFVLGAARRRAQTIVYTEVGRAYGVAAQERQLQAQALVPGLKKQWRRSRKIHSRATHDAIDGQIQDVDQPFVLPNGIRLMHPRDPKGPAAETINCGCVSLPYMESWSVREPGRVPYTEGEILMDSRKFQEFMGRGEVEK